MADIQLVITIPAELYEAYKGRPPMLGDAGMDMIAQSIANGTPLPKGHGRLIDESKIKKCGWNFIDHHAKTDAPTIIEADRSEEDG